MDFAEDNTNPDLGTHFTNANEWTYRNITIGGSDRDLDHDANGNMIDDGGDYDYEYDAWNRLTAILVWNTSTVVAEYRSNGLGQRTARRQAWRRPHAAWSRSVRGCALFASYRESPGRDRWPSGLS